MIFWLSSLALTQGGQWIKAPWTRRLQSLPLHHQDQSNPGENEQSNGANLGQDIHDSHAMFPDSSLVKTLTLCPLIPGRPGVPGNPRAPCVTEGTHQQVSIQEIKCVIWISLVCSIPE